MCPAAFGVSDRVLTGKRVWLVMVKKYIVINETIEVIFKLLADKV